jgi:hypothetical protein
MYSGKNNTTAGAVIQKVFKMLPVASSKCDSKKLPLGI